MYIITNAQRDTVKTNSINFWKERICLSVVSVSTVILYCYDQRERSHSVYSPVQPKWELRSVVCISQYTSAHKVLNEVSSVCIMNVAASVFVAFVWQRNCLWDKSFDWRNFNNRAFLDDVLIHSKYFCVLAYLWNLFFPNDEQKFNSHTSDAFSVLI